MDAAGKVVLDKKGEPIYQNVDHSIQPNFCKQVGKDDNGKPIFESPPFAVHDVEYVLEKHGSILKKA